MHLVAETQHPPRHQSFYSAAPEAPSRTARCIFMSGRNGTPNSDALESFTKALAYNVTISTFLTGFCFSGIAQFKKDNTIHVDLLSSFRGSAFVAATILMASVMWNSGFLTAANMIIASSKRTQKDLSPRIFIFAWFATAVGLFLLIASLFCFFETLKAAVKIQTDALGVQIEISHLMWPIGAGGLLVTLTIGGIVYFFGDATLWSRQPQGRKEE